MINEKSTKNMDIHNLLFSRLTKLAFYGSSDLSDIEGFDMVGNDVNCSLCKRPINKQPIEYKQLAFSGKNTYKQNMTYCVCCAAFFQNNPDVMGIEKPSAPNTSQKFGMLAGTGALIELNTNRTILFMPEKSARKIPSSTHKIMASMKIELVEITQYDQLTYLSNADITYPVLWVNNFGKKTHLLIKNLKVSTSPNALNMVTDDELNASSEIMFKIDLESLTTFANLFNANKDKAKFKKAIAELSNGRMSPKSMANEIQKYPSFVELLKLLPKDPHQRIEYLRLAGKV